MRTTMPNTMLKTTVISAGVSIDHRNPRLEFL
jgi:hypothetical protein